MKPLETIEKRQTDKNQSHVVDNMVQEIGNFKEEILKVMDNTGKEHEAILQESDQLRRSLYGGGNRQEQLQRLEKLDALVRNSSQNVEKAQQVTQKLAGVLDYLQKDLSVAKLQLEFGAELPYGVKILEAQENERKRISRDIHDGPAQYIANILMKADLCEQIMKRDVGQGLEELGELKTTVRQALKEIRGIIYNLRPMSLDDLGLNKTMEEFVNRVKEEARFNITLRQQHVEDEIEMIIQVAVFRILQEIINNVKKHSKADNVQIQLRFGMKYLKLVVQDDGVGFEVEKTLLRVKEQGVSYGLVGIYERVNQLHGHINIDSAPGQGTTYSILLPVSLEVIQDEFKNH
ncbi:sensor histidine kinase [Anaerotalea alkaliphila]|uniref:Oxygen sensor histidine kinase NreB n=1 Tax=Anaerotalea alkaliphila TaxID=2662126 RepID=A0A7X5HVC5_9FIRM|nr:sensor histidine kinase [Anaerotalea alkaliphila]NDL67328.1 sensor histidine kinase [Anaerotalea alkaliphila]